jgi:hypothetical protein
MKTHEEIDGRSLELARALVAMIDQDPLRTGVERARANCARWLLATPSPALEEWRDILRGEWTQIRASLLDESERGVRLRQSNPFAGVLSPRVRWSIYKRWSHDKSSA